MSETARRSSPAFAGPNPQPDRHAALLSAVSNFLAAHDGVIASFAREGKVARTMAALDERDRLMAAQQEAIAALRIAYADSRRTR